LNQIDDTVLEALSNNEKVNDFEFFQVSGSAFATIPFERFLHVIHLTVLACHTLENSHLTGLSKLGGLRSLCLEDCSSLTGDCAPVLSGLRHLELLSLFGSHNIGKSGIRAIIDALEKLEWVDFGETQVDDDGVEALFSRSVQSIAIRDTRISDHAFHKAGSSGTLTEIDAAHCAISDTSVMHLAKCGKLEALNFSFCKNISTRSVDYLLQMPHLKRLDLSGCRHIAADSFAGLSNLKKLEKLGLNRTMVTDDAVHAFASLESLDCLDLFGCTGISPRALEFITDIKSLKKVRISNSGITQALSITAVREKYPGIEWG
jgi:Leucine-rich repeat (LRR) protein